MSGHGYQATSLTWILFAAWLLVAGATILAVLFWLLRHRPRRKRLIGDLERQWSYFPLFVLLNLLCISAVLLSVTPTPALENLLCLWVPVLIGAALAYAHFKRGAALLKRMNEKQKRNQRSGDTDGQDGESEALDE